jgi:hypothetical protein
VYLCWSVVQYDSVYTEYFRFKSGFIAYQLQQKFMWITKITLLYFKGTFSRKKLLICKKTMMSKISFPCINLIIVIVRPPSVNLYPVLRMRCRIILFCLTKKSTRCWHHRLPDSGLGWSFKKSSECVLFLHKLKNCCYNIEGGKV